MKLTFKDIEEKGLLLYKYIRGSHLYNINTPESDVDEGGVYICPPQRLIDLGFDYQDEVSDEKHDTTWWELGKFMRLLLSSNPTVLESLFVPEDKVIYEHPIITEIKKHRMEFLTKQCFMPFGGYAVSQIRKAQGQNKYIHWDVENMTRKTPMDFCYTFDDKQGSKPMQEWLSARGLRQDCCGLVNIPNMPGMYGVYYDFGQHFRLENITRVEEICGEVDTNVDPNVKLLAGDDFPDPATSKYPELRKYILSKYPDQEIFDTMFHWRIWFNQNYTPLGGYCGIVKTTFEDENDRSPKDESKSNTIRFSETPKGSKPICFMSYNDNGYQTHCKKYREYCEWKEKRNKARYENNLQGVVDEEEKRSKFYDAKNMSHCFRLMAMCIEVAQGNPLKLDRTEIDREFLMDVRQRKYTYEQLMTRLEALKEEMDKAAVESTIPDTIDTGTVNEMLLTARNEFWMQKYMEDDDVNGLVFCH